SLLGNLRETRGIRHFVATRSRRRSQAESAGFRSAVPGPSSRRPSAQAAASWKEQKATPPQSRHDHVRSPLTVFHLHSGKERQGERVLSTSPRDSLPREALSRRHRHQAERISSRIVVVPESSLPPQPLSCKPPSRRSSFSVPPSTPPIPLVRATAPSPPCRIQMSLFSGPLRSPFTQPVRGYEERQRARKRLRGCLGEGAGESWVVKAGSIRAPPTDTLAPNKRVGALSSWLLEEPATVCDKIA
ncbi:hypothetical protein ALC62_09988, partial [Cyphomyrmex costatus]